LPCPPELPAKGHLLRVPQECSVALPSRGNSHTNTGRCPSKHCPAGTMYRLWILDLQLPGGRQQGQSEKKD